MLASDFDDTNSLIESDFDQTKRYAYQYMKSIRIISLIDAFMIFFYCVFIWPALLLFFFPISGYISAKKYRKQGIFCYIFYLLGNIGFRIFLIYDSSNQTHIFKNNPGIGFLIINSIGIFINLWAIELCYKGIKSLNSLDISQILELRNNEYLSKRIKFIYF